MRNDDRAPELAVAQWFNTPRPLTLAGLHGRPVLLHAFQMLCPGCVATALPQAERAHRLFQGTDLQVIGLHTVFEHHAAMPPVALAAFLHEYRLTFPVGVDTPGRGDPVPETMRRYSFRGTPSLVLIGRDGRVRHHGFGAEDDMALGARIAAALAEEPVIAATKVDRDDCADGLCHFRAAAHIVQQKAEMTCS